MLATASCSKLCTHCAFAGLLLNGMCHFRTTAGTNAVDFSDRLAKLSRVARVTAELHLGGANMATIRVKTARSVNDVQDHLAQALLSGIPLRADELIDPATYDAIISAAAALDDTGPKADFL